MDSRAGAGHHTIVLSPSWPSAADTRRVVTPQVRRRVRAAERRSMRRAVLVSALLMSLLLVIDLAVNFLVGTPGITLLAPYSLAAASLCAGVAVIVRRGVVPPEPTGLVAMLAVVGVALLGLVLTPSGRTLGMAQIATILVGIGLFFPWDRRWHIAGLLAAIVLAAALVLTPIGAAMGPNDQLNVMVGVLMAAATSLVGHGLRHGRVRGMLEQQFALRSLSRYAQRQEAHVTELNRELNRVARRDSLTGVGNRRALDEGIARLLEQGDRLRPLPFAIVLFDIDHFKAYNDEHGHLAGDAALGRLGEILRRGTRGGDQAFRYGGEEFLLLLPDIDLNGAIVAAERVRVAVEEATGVPAFTVSGGVALCDPADGRDPEPLLRRADAALYLAKRAGRNRISADELSAAMMRSEIASA